MSKNKKENNQLSQFWGLTQISTLRLWHDLRKNQANFVSASWKLHNPPDTSICGRILEQDWGNQIQLCQLEHHRSYFLCLPLHICLGRYFIRQLSTPIYKLFGPHIQSGSSKALYFPPKGSFYIESTLKFWNYITYKSDWKG